MTIEKKITVELDEEEVDAFLTVQKCFDTICNTGVACDDCPLNRFCDSRLDIDSTMTEILEALGKR